MTHPHATLLRDPEVLRSLPDAINLDAEVCRRSLSKFIKGAWHAIEPSTQYTPGWHIDAIAEHLQAVSAGQIKNLLINVPPGSAKSVTTCVFWPTHHWITHPHHRWLFSSYSDDLTVRDNNRSKALIDSPWYQQRFGHRYRVTRSSDHSILNDKTGFRIASSVGGMGTGERVNISVNDDLIRANDALSEAKRKAAIDHLKAMATRGLDPQNYAQVIIMQRIHELDPAAWALKMGWDHLVIPMEYEPRRSKVTQIGWKDPRTQPGELMFPARFPRTVVENLKTSLGEYKTAAELQQFPNPLGGGLIKGTYFFRVDTPPPALYSIIVADTAQKTGEANDYTVLACVSKLQDNRIVIVDLLRERLDAPNLLTRAKEFWAKQRAIPSRGTIRFMAVEDKSSGTGLIQQLATLNSIPIVPIPRGIDKLTRVMDIQTYLSSGFVGVLSTGAWVNDFITECESFSAAGTHAHDDQVDVLADAVKLLVADEEEFHRYLEGFCIPQRWVEAALRLPILLQAHPLYVHHLTPPPTTLGCAGLTLGAGRSRATLIPRFGAIVYAPIPCGDPDAAATANEAVTAAEAFSPAPHTAIASVRYDSSTAAAAAQSTLAYSTQKVTVAPIEPLGPPSDTAWPDGEDSTTKFLNAKAEMWWVMRAKFKAAYDLAAAIEGTPAGTPLPHIDTTSAIMLPAPTSDDPNDPARVLAQQLTEPRWSKNDKNKIVIEKKTTVGLDYADGLALTYAPNAIADVWAKLGA